MKTRTQFFMIVALISLILGASWLIYSTRNQQSPQILLATINRDCAPWDGAAFTLSIPTEDGIMLHVSIWQSPEIKLPVTFTFPDETGQIGFAYILPELDPLQQLRGEIFFWRVEQGIPVEGEFSFTTESGKKFKGRFNAEWGDQVVYCG
jgi:hypothetical protein